MLKRAAELQGPTDTSGLTLAELEQIAAEVGIDPAFVKTAATELEEGRPDTGFHFWGGPLSVDLERIVEGRVSEAKWEEAVAEIRRVFETAGETGKVGRTLEWTHRNQTGERMHVTVTPMSGQTRIRIFSRLGDWAAAFHAPILSVSLALTILQFILLHLGLVLETGLALFIMGAAFMLARLAFGALGRSQERKARKLLTRLDDLMSEPEAVRSIQIPDEFLKKGRIDASLLSDEETPEEIPPAQRQERERGS